MCNSLALLTPFSFTTFSFYLGSSIYTPAQPEVMAKFGASQPVASLGMALYIAGYGIGPLLWSPLSECVYL